MGESTLLCPDCGGEVTYYHASFKLGDGHTRVVCSKKCSGWKIIKEYERGKEMEIPEEPTSKEVHISSLVKTLEAISPDVSEQACTKYLKNRNYSVVRIT